VSVDEGLLPAKLSTGGENPGPPPRPSAGSSASKTPQASTLFLEPKSSVPATPKAAAAVGLTPPVPGSPPQRAAQSSDEESLLNTLISLLESGQEELRSWRTALIGSVAGAFAIPIGTLAAQTTDFLMIGQLHVGKIPVNLVASSLLFFWSLGVVLLAWGFFEVLPKEHVGENEATETTIRTLIVSAVLHRNKELLQRCITLQNGQLRKTKRAARLFGRATACFLLSVGVELIGFVIKKCL
jgi:hypothetical protein